MSKKNFHKRHLEKEVTAKIKQGISRHEILEDLSSIYHNAPEIAIIVARQFKKQTKIKTIKVKTNHRY